MGCTVFLAGLGLLLVAVEGGIVDLSSLQRARLSGFLLTKVMVPTVYQCLELCLAMPRCQSINYDSVTWHCEVNHQSESTGFSPNTSQTAWLHAKREDVLNTGLADPCAGLACKSHEMCAITGCGSSRCIAYAEEEKPNYDFVDCGPPPLPPVKMTLTYSGTGYGDVANYTCPVNLAVTPDTGIVVCNASSLWAGDPGSCYSPTGDCGPPPAAPAGMTLTSSGTHYRDVAEYTCPLFQYRWKDTGVLTCNIMAEWEGRPGGCSIYLDDCGPPPDPGLGMNVSYSGTRLLKQAVYTCQAGLTQWPGTGTLTCAITRQWDGDVGGCSPVTCYDPRQTAPYAGNRQTTLSGYECQNWANVLPKPHIYFLHLYHKVDGTVWAAKNYCRAVNDVRPWCMVKAPVWELPHWEYCDVPRC